MSTVEIECEVRVVTRNAIQIHDGKRTEWIPKVLVHYELGEVTPHGTHCA